MNKIILASIVFFLACTKIKNPSDDPIAKPYKMPENPFPSIMEQFYSYKLPVYRFEIKTNNLAFDCTKRNDSELYWCGIDTELMHPDKNLPHLITMLLSSSISSEDIDFYRAAIKRFSSNTHPTFLLGIFPSKMEIEGKTSIFGKYYGIYNAQECLNWYGYFEDCPKGSVAIK